MPAFLVPVDPGHCLIPLEKAIVLIGRQSDCDVSLTLSRKISRKHCCIAQVDNKFVVRDLGSTNGVFVNNVRVDGSCPLKAADDILIGGTRLIFQQAGDHAAVPAKFSAAGQSPQADSAMAVDDRADRNRFDL